MSEEKIIVVDDDHTTAKIVKMQLTKLGYDVVAVANSGEDAINLTEVHKPDLLLMDIKLGRGLDGIDAASILMEKFQTPVIYLTAHADEKILTRALATNPLGYVNKPLREKDLLTTISLAFEQINERKKQSAVADSNEAREENWKTQLTVDAEGSIIKEHPDCAKQIKSLGFTRIQDLLPSSNLEQIRTCLQTRKPRTVSVKHGRRMVTFEYRPSAKLDQVRILISNNQAADTLKQHRIQQNILLEALDHLATGIVLVNENLNIFYSNKASDRLLDAGECMKKKNGCLACLDPEYTASLQKIVLDGTDQTLSLSRGDKTAPLYLLVTPLQTHKRNYGLNMPTSIVFIFESLNNIERVEDVIRSLYNLSRSESRIAASLILTPNLEQVANNLGITYNTARTHLKHIYTKTHTNRLSTLLHMLVTGPVGVILQSDT